MEFEYNWQNNEANFGPPIQKEADGGTHITCEIILKKGDKYIALRRSCLPGHEKPPSVGNPKGALFFCHNLIRYGESIEECTKRIVKEQSGVNVINYKVVDVRAFLMEESGGKKMKQWAIVPHIIAEIDKIPQPGVYGNEITEVVEFTKDNVPTDFAWGKTERIKELLD